MGKRILKVNADVSLVDGTANARKNQIREVTSHYRNGWVYLLVYPKLLVAAENADKQQPTFIDYNEIKPLVIKRLVVMAKKAGKTKKDKLARKTEQINGILMRKHDASAFHNHTG